MRHRYTLDTSCPNDVAGIEAGGAECALIIRCRHSYVEGRLRLAEKERARIKAKAPGGVPSTAAAGPSDEQLAALEAAADANMAALLQEEEVQKASVPSPLNSKLRTLVLSSTGARCHWGHSLPPAHLLLK